MSDLPTGSYQFYIGIDPGFEGAIAQINAAGTSIKVWDLPITTKGKDRDREFDIPVLHSIFKSLKPLPSLVVGLEWPTTRPGEGAERSERFGRGKGILQTCLCLMGFEHYLISPNLWKPRLGVPGKANPNANKIGAILIDSYYPTHKHLIRGPRGGIRSGSLDALLIAHFLRTRSVGGLRSVVNTYGKDSPEAQALVLGSGGRRGKKSIMRIDKPR